jgi:hypothetical protein
MTEPSTSEDTSADTPYQVVISDQAMEQIKGLPPEAVDELAATIGQLRQNPAGVDSFPLVPVPVDHSEDREQTYVPPTRSVGYLRNAVADISPETVSHFDDELQQMTRLDEDGRDGQIRRFRIFVMRWVEYIALQGDHATARHVNSSTSGEELAERYQAAMRRIHETYFPDAGREPGRELMVQTLTRTGGGWTAICPVTQLRADGPTEGQAQDRLRGLLLEWITG